MRSVFNKKRLITIIGTNIALVVLLAIVFFTSSFQSSYAVTNVGANKVYGTGLLPIELYKNGSKYATVNLTYSRTSPTGNDWDTVLKSSSTWSVSSDKSEMIKLVNTTLKTDKMDDDSTTYLRFDDHYINLFMPAGYHIDKNEKIIDGTDCMVASASEAKCRLVLGLYADEDVDISNTPDYWAGSDTDSDRWIPIYLHISMETIGAKTRNGILYDNSMERLYLKGNTKTVIYDGNDNTGGATAPSTHIFGVSSKISNNGFTKLGYTFTGWNTEDDGSGTAYSVGQNVSNNRNFMTEDEMELYAQWNPITYSISYNLNGGTADDNPKTYTIEDIDGDSIELEEPERAGYEFVGWTGSNGNTPDKNVSITEKNIGNKQYIANWKKIVYPIEYDLDGGEVAGNPTTYTVEDEAITLNNPTRKGYKFLGWTGTEIDEPSLKVIIPKGSIDEREYAAEWEIIEYKIDYDLAGGEVEEENPDIYTVEDDAITLNNPTRVGYKFLGWTGTEIDEPSLEVTIPQGSIENREYKANWEIITYFIKYDLGGGKVEGNPITYTVEDDTITLNNPTRKGYKFLGWTGTEIDEPNLEVTIPQGSIENREYKANWEVITYSIKCDLGGGKVEGNPTTYTVEDESITLNNPTRVGYKFLGWTGTNLKGLSLEVTIPQGSIENREYKANWEIITYFIEYDLDGGEVEGNPKKYTVEDEPIVIKNPTRKGYRFVGWMGTGIERHNDELIIGKQDTGDKEYKAIWEELGRYEIEREKNDDKDNDRCFIVKNINGRVLKNIDVTAKVDKNIFKSLNSSHISSEKSYITDLNGRLCFTLINKTDDVINSFEKSNMFLTEQDEKVEFPVMKEFEKIRCIKGVCTLVPEDTTKPKNQTDEYLITRISSDSVDNVFKIEDKNEDALSGVTVEITADEAIFESEEEQIQQTAIKGKNFARVKPLINFSKNSSYSGAINLEKNSFNSTNIVKGKTFASVGFTLINNSPEVKEVFERSKIKIIDGNNEILDIPMVPDSVRIRTKDNCSGLKCIKTTAKIRDYKVIREDTGKNKCLTLENNSDNDLSGTIITISSNEKIFENGKTAYRVLGLNDSVCFMLKDDSKNTEDAFNKSKIGLIMNGNEIGSSVMIPNEKTGVIVLNNGSRINSKVIILIATLILILIIVCFIVYELINYKKKGKSHEEKKEYQK